jgi:hypothetical protein
MLLTNRTWEGSSLTASATSMRRKHQWLLPPGATHIQVLVGGPDLASKEQASVAVSSNAVTAQAATGRTLHRATVLTDKEKIQLIVPYVGSPSSACRARHVLDRE